MIGWAPARAAPCTIERPMPPAPNTATDWPIATCALALTTPKAVVIAQPKRAAASTSKSAGTAVTRFSDTIACSLNVVTQPAFTVPSREP